MKTTIHNLSDLREFGINLLTGESCAFSRRLLCDVTQAGKDLIIQALGVQDISLCNSWNGGDAIGSILLERDTLLTCAILALLKVSGTVEVWETQDGWLSAMDKATLQLYIDNDYESEGVRKYRMFSIGSIDGRNVHQMSGRTV